MHRIRRAEVHPGPVGIRAQRLHGVRDVPAHVHDFFELAVVRGGQGTHVSAGGSQLLTPGTVLLVRPGEWHGYPGPDPLDVDNVYVAADVLRRHLRWFTHGPAAREVLWPATAPASPYTVHLGPAGLEESQRWVDALLERQQGAGATTLLGLLLTASRVSVRREAARSARSRARCSSGGDPRWRLKSRLRCPGETRTSAASSVVDHGRARSASRASAASSTVAGTRRAPSQTSSPRSGTAAARMQKRSPTGPRPCPSPATRLRVASTRLDNLAVMSRSCAGPSRRP